MQVEVESGLQLFARLRDKGNIIKLDDTLFFNGLRNDDIIEISGNTSSGKTLLTTQLIAKCILPIQYKEISIGGCNACALLLNTDHHFLISKLVSIMVSIIRNTVAPMEIDKETIDVIVSSSLDNLVVIDCYDTDQFSLTLHTLEMIFFRNEKIILVAIDSISAYYWQYREKQRTNMCSLNSYIKNLLKVIQKYNSRFGIITVYTRLAKLTSKDGKPIEDVNDLLIEKINYRIVLRKNGSLPEFGCTVQSTNSTKFTPYTICDNGISWTMKRKQSDVMK